MVRISPFHRLMFALAIALVAAALSDPLVEVISKTGAFGRAFADDSQQAVVPVLLAGLAAVALFVAVRAASLLSRRAGSTRAPLREITLACAERLDARSLAAIFAAQLAIVYAMECCEAAFGSGQAVVGCSWLGAPVVAALCLHFVACVAAVYLVKAGVRFCLAGVLAAITYVLERFVAERARGERSGLAHRCAIRVPSRFELLYVRRLRGRAPPLLAASV